MKKMIIIGASSGIGARLARDYAAQGYRLGIAARREEPLRQLQEDYPGQIEWETIDVTAADAVDRLGMLIDKVGGLDILVHASGVGFDDEMQDSVLTKVLNTNVTGFARMIAAAYRYFRDNGVRGQIAAITSVAGEKGMGVLPAYSASKRFDRTFLDALDQLSHEEKAGVSFTDIRPGFIATALLVPGKSYNMLMTLDHVSPLIERAIDSRKRVAYVDWRFGLLARAWRMLPQWLWVHFSSKHFA